MKSFITATCFDSSYSAIVRLSSKKCYIQLGMLYKVRDLVYNLINNNNNNNYYYYLILGP
jgi:hypothetical protein